MAFRRSHVVGLVLFALVLLSQRASVSQSTDFSEGLHPNKSDPGQPKGQCINVPCICTREYIPVCYKGQNYGNPCEARCAGARDSELVHGQCKNFSSCVCPRILDPVCLDGVTYSNRCIAECAMATVGRFAVGACDALYFDNRH
ncbi:uncharacterized protein LOC111247353 [Varroa destructor]|uniref:Kazal-like domain-containing protein n=1 Tax=Varroa destructor TaxID=109461 RepID=A0A7M7JL78_VARDE|nr:uncharacterized protein LOC111247353 [Varroa destructor]